MRVWRLGTSEGLARNSARSWRPPYGASKRTMPNVKSEGGGRGRKDTGRRGLSEPERASKGTRRRGFSDGELGQLLRVYVATSRVSCFLSGHPPQRHHSFSADGSAEVRGT